MAANFGEEHQTNPPPDNNYTNDDGDNAANNAGSDRRKGVLLREEGMRLAIYIAMAHGGLALLFALIYGLSRLLQDYRRPIQWAFLCSMPLRELHTAIVSFWSHPLSLGLPETLIAVPLAILRSAASALIDSHAALHRLLRCQIPQQRHSPRLGFSNLMRWLLSFALFVLLYERFGLFVFPFFVLPGFLASARPRPPPLTATLSAFSFARHSRKQSSSDPSPPRAIRGTLTSLIHRRLNTLVAVNLILAMIVASLTGSLLFSYKITIEGRGAVSALKTHFQEHNYTERIGLQRWMDDHDVPELIESGASKLYRSAVRYVDSLALQYNATDLADGFKLYLIKPLEESFNSSSFTAKKSSSFHPLPMNIHNLVHHVGNRNWRQMYENLDSTMKEFLSVIARDDLVESIKAFALQSIDISQKILASGSMVFYGSANLLLSISLSIVSGAAGLLNFISQIFIFFWLLYSLITSESGVMDHVLGMLPISKSKRVRCAVVLDHAVSSVMLAAVKIALFQGCFTYLLFRFYHIHFLYASTFIACTSAILPITPFWLSSLPAAVQLAVDGKYAEALVLTSIHLFVLDYGTLAIQNEIPGQNAYLTGLSILGGMALFPSVLEGAIMGPLLLTVMIAVKNLYAEFVLGSSKISTN